MARAKATHSNAAGALLNVADGIQRETSSAAGSAEVARVFDEVPSVRRRHCLSPPPLPHPSPAAQVFFRQDFSLASPDTFHTVTNLATPMVLDEKVPSAPPPCSPVTRSHCWFPPVPRSPACLLAAEPLPGPRRGVAAHADIQALGLVLPGTGTASGIRGVPLALLLTPHHSAAPLTRALGPTAGGRGTRLPPGQQHETVPALAARPRHRRVTAGTAAAAAARERPLPAADSAFAPHCQAGLVCWQARLTPRPPRHSCAAWTNCERWARLCGRCLSAAPTRQPSQPSSPRMP